MTRSKSSLESLRHAFVAGDDSTAPGPGCPSAVEIWDAAHGELDPERARELVTHVGTCAACAADWHLALSDEGRPALADEPAQPSTAGGTWIRLVGVAALLAGIAWLGVRTTRERSVEPIFRQAESGSGIHALTLESTPISRGDATLRWSPVEDGARYTVEISTEDLEPLYTARGLTTNELPIPPQVLARIGTGESIVWHVEARLADGSRVRSGAFVHRIE